MTEYGTSMQSGDVHPAVNGQSLSEPISTKIIVYKMSYQWRLIVQTIESINL